MTVDNHEQPAMTRDEAEALFDEIRSGLVNVEKNIIRAIETRAWAVLGYESFSAAWSDRLMGTRLGADVLKAHVVYELLDEAEGEPTATPALVESDADDDDPASTDDDPAVRRVHEQLGGIGSGVTPDAVAQLKRQKSNGVPPDLATTRVRSHTRARPSSPRFVSAELTEDEHVHFQELCERGNSNVKTEAQKAIRAWIRKLEESR